MKYAMTIPANKIRKIIVNWSSFNAGAILAGPMVFEGTQTDSIKIDRIVVQPMNGDEAVSFCPKKTELMMALDEVTFEHC